MNKPISPFPTISLIVFIDFRSQPGGTSNTRTLNSLSAITGHEGEEEDWEREMRDLNRGDDEVSPPALSPQSHLALPFSHRQAPSW